MFISVLDLGMFFFSHCLSDKFFKCCLYRLVSTTKVNGEMTLDEPLTETGRWQAESVRQQLIVGSLLKLAKTL